MAPVNGLKFLFAPCVAVVDHIRYLGTAMLLPKLGQGAIPDPTEVWCMFRYTGSRTAEEDWGDFGPVDHITCDTAGLKQGSDSKGLLLLAAGVWQWHGFDGKPM